MGYLLKPDGGRLLKSDGGGLLVHEAQPVIWVPVVSPGTLADVLRTHHMPVSRVVFLDDDLVTHLFSVSSTELTHDNRRLLDGSVNGDRFRDNHLAGDVSLVTDGELFNPRAAADLVWPERPVLLERGAVVGQTPIYEPLMLGLIEAPSEQAYSDHIGFSVRSRLTLLSKTYPEPITFDTGTRVRDVVRAVFELGGYGTSDELYDLTAGGITLAAPQTYDSQDTMLASMVRLAFDVGCDLWDAGDGVLHMEPFADPSAVDPTWEFEPGTDSTLLNLKVTRRAQAVYNRQEVGGTGADGYPIWGEAKITDPADPLYWTAASDRPARPYTITGVVATQQMVNAVAQRLLIERSYFLEEVEGEIAANPLVTDRRVVGVVGAGVADRYLIDSFTLGLGPGMMRISSRKARSLVSA